jgi:hypothetical protein
MFNRAEPSAANRYQAAHAALIADSYRRLIGRELMPPRADAAAFARALYEGAFVVLAHDAAEDPVFFYANLAAQRLFEMDWSAMTAMPSRFSAEAPAQTVRQDFLARVARDGFVDDYAGVRISRSGRRFAISGATVWNLLDAGGRRSGQAACFAEWTRL